MSAVLTPPRPTPAPAAAPPAPSMVTPPPTALPSGAQLPPQPFRWTLKQYRDHLPKTGLFHDTKTMLLDGVLYVMGMPNPDHDLALGKADDTLRAVFAPPGHHVRNQMGFDIGEDTDPGPDLVAVAGTRDDYRGRTPTAAVLIVEVAESSLFTDTTTKAEKYATANVPDYWVIDLENRLLLVFRDPEPLPAGLGATAYRTHLTLSETDSITPLAAPGASVRVAELLP